MLNKIAENIWTVNGSTVNFLGIPFPTRMTIIRLKNSRLWIHSPVQMGAMFDDVSSLGEVCYLISPNKLHHLFIADWQKKFPAARCYASPGIIKKRPDIDFYKELGMDAENEWAEELEQTVFRGSPVMQEVVFYHKSSKTLILTEPLLTAGSRKILLLPMGSVLLAAGMNFYASHLDGYCKRRSKSFT